MTDISIGEFTLANIKTALESIGFTADENDASIFWWNDDTSKHFYMQFVTSGSNLVPKMYYSNGTVVYNNSNISIATTAQAKLSYELLRGGGIAIGFSLASFTGSRINFIISAPVAQTDHWMIVIYNNNYLYDAETRTGIAHSYASVRTDDVSVVQIVKCHNGLNFCENIFYTTICKKIGTYTNDNTLRATIGGNLYLVVNMAGAETNGKWAVRIAS